jgi:hypothetical protein
MASAVGQSLRILDLVGTALTAAEAREYKERLREGEL